jgi:basic amino acid/polyamine antiporter, APA family
MRSLWRKKAIGDLQEEAHGEHGMRRALGPINLTAIGIGGIIGAGIFVLTGKVAAEHAGPAIVISFMLAAFACAFAGLCYAEFSAMIPIAGSAYTYAYATLGEFFAWFIGWDLVLEYAMGAATVAVGWSGYLNSFLQGFGVTIPPQLTASPGTVLVNVPAQLVAAQHLAMPAGWQTLSETLSGYLTQHGVSAASLTQVTGLLNLPAAFVVLIVTALLVVGIQESARFNAVIVVIKVAIVLTIICVGVAFVKTAFWKPFIPENTGSFGSFGWSGIFRGAGVIFFAYIGFDAVSTAAQEAKNPQRDLPVGILVSLAVCTVLYILVGLVITGVVSYKTLLVPDPIAVAIDAMGIPWLAKIVKLGAIAGMTSVILVLLLGQPRIFFTMSRDGLLPPVFSRLHSRFRTPHVTTILTGIVVAIVAALVPLHVIGELVSIGTLAAFAIVCASVLVLRYRQPELRRPFKTPLVPFVPILGIVSCLALMIPLPLDTWLRLAVWLVIGLAIYFLYGIKHSKLRSTPAASDPVAK